MAENDLANEISRIGQEMVCRHDPCRGINQDPISGVLPRCLILESCDDTTKMGCAVIGLNPGRASNQEKAFYTENGNTYDATQKWWTENVGYRHPYYKRLRQLIQRFGIKGTILWTELAKCENHKETKGLLPISTFRNCTGRYLRREIELLPDAWPLFAVGKEAFKATGYLFPNRTVIGLPHPTGSFGDFARISKDDPACKKVSEILVRPDQQIEWIN